MDQRPPHPAYSNATEDSDQEGSLRDAPATSVCDIESSSHTSSLSFGIYQHPQFDDANTLLKNLTQVSQCVNPAAFYLPGRHCPNVYNSQSIDTVPHGLSEQLSGYCSNSKLPMSLVPNMGHAPSLTNLSDNCSSHVVRTRRRKISNAEEARVCVVCGEPASGYNFDRLTCESCKAFFRRNALKPRDKIKACSRSGGCNISGSQRKHCPSCRLDKCLSVGMKRELILPPEKLEQRAKPRRRKHQSADDCSVSSGGPAGDGVGAGTSSVCGFRDFSVSQASPMPLGTFTDTGSHRRLNLPNPTSLVHQQQRQNGGRVPPLHLSHAIRAPIHHPDYGQGGENDVMGSVPSTAAAALFSSGFGPHSRMTMGAPPVLPIPHLRSGSGVGGGGVAGGNGRFPVDERHPDADTPNAWSVASGDIFPSAPPVQAADEASERLSRSSGLVRAHRCRLTQFATFCRHRVCRRLHLRRRRRLAAAASAGILEPGVQLEAPDPQFLGCLAECVQQIREPFTPEEQLETEAAETLEQEYNRMDTCIRRIIRIVKVLPYFNDIGKPAQLSLLRANIYGLIVLYSSFFFERNLRKLRYPILQPDGSISTVTVSMLDEIATPDREASLSGDAHQRDGSTLTIADSSGGVDSNRKSGLREDFELYKTNTLAAFDHLDELANGDDTLRVALLAIKLFADESLTEELRGPVVAAQRAYLIFLWTYLRWRAGSKNLSRAADLYARLLIAFIDLRTLEIRMTEFAKLLSLDGLSPLMREVCSQRCALAATRN